MCNAFIRAELLYQLLHSRLKSIMKGGAGRRRILKALTEQRVHLRHEPWQQLRSPWLTAEMDGSCRKVSQPTRDQSGEKLNKRGGNSRCILCLADLTLCGHCNTHDCSSAAIFKCQRQSATSFYFHSPRTLGGDSSTWAILINKLAVLQHLSMYQLKLHRPLQDKDGRVKGPWAHMLLWAQQNHNKQLSIKMTGTYPKKILYIQTHKEETTRW